MFSRQTLFILKFYDGFGFLNQYSTTQNYQKRIKIIFSIHLSIAIFLYIFKGYVIVHLKTFLIPLDLVSELLQYSSASIAYFFITIESYAQQKKQKHFWKLYEKLRHQKSITWRKYFIKILFWFFICIIPTITMFFQETIDPIIHIAYSYLQKVCQLRIFHYLFYLELIQFQLKFIENDIAIMLWRNERESPIRFNRLKSIREYYRIIQDMVDDLNEVFGWSHLFAVLFSFHYLLTDVNWAHSHLRNEISFDHLSN